MFTSHLARFIYYTRLSDIPEDVVDQAKMHILDTIGVALAGSRNSLGTIMASHVKRLGGNPDASVIGHGFRTSAPLAALANGTMGNILDLDDDSDTIYSHPSTTLLPTVFALGEHTATGQEMLTAYILGEEVAARVAKVAGLLPGHYERGWHPTSTLGIIGGAAAAAKVLKLDLTGICNAFGIAASDASGLTANFGSMTKSYHAGSTASKAVSAGLLSKAGVTANPRALECPGGFLDVFGGDRACDFSVLTGSLGKAWDFLDPGVNIKLYPSCYYTHSAVDLLLEIMEEKSFSSEEIESIYCGISPLADKLLIDQMPTSGLDSRYYMPYCLAVAAVCSTLSISHFEDPLFIDQPEVQRLMDSVRTVVVSELDDIGFGLGARIAVTTRSHGTISKSKAKPRGGGQDPLSWHEIITKFRSCTEKMLTVENQLKIENLVHSIENLDTITDFLDIVRG